MSHCIIVKKNEKVIAYEYSAHKNAKKALAGVKKIYHGQNGVSFEVEKASV